MSWTHRPEQRLGRKFRTRGREVIGTKQTYEILGPEDSEGFYTVIAKGLTPENARLIVGLESTITTQSDALRLAVEAFGPLGETRRFCTKCGSVAASDAPAIGGQRQCLLCGYLMVNCAPKDEAVAALAACREALGEPT